MTSSRFLFLPHISATTASVSPFSRTLLQRLPSHQSSSAHQIPLHSRTPRTYLQLSPFSTSQIFSSLKKSSKAAKATKAPKGHAPKSQNPSAAVANKKPQSSSSSSSHSLPPSSQPLPESQVRYFSLASLLASKPEPTLLYKCPLTMSMIASYSIAIFTIFMSYNIYVTIILPVRRIANSTAEADKSSSGISSIWVLIVSFVSIGLLSVATTATFWSPSRNIRRIYALPARISASNNARQQRPSILHLKIEKQNLIPFLPYKSYTIPVTDVSIDRPIDSIPSAQGTEGSSMERIQGDHQSHKPGTSFDKIVEFAALLPFRVFNFSRKFVSRSDLVRVRISGSMTDLVLEPPETNRGVWQWERKGLDRLIFVNKHF